MKAKGWCSCINTAPISYPEASTYTTKVLLKSGRARRGADMNPSFNCWNEPLAFPVFM